MAATEIAWQRVGHGALYGHLQYPRTTVGRAGQSFWRKSSCSDAVHAPGDLLAAPHLPQACHLALVGRREADSR